MCAIWCGLIELSGQSGLGRCIHTSECQSSFLEWHLNAVCVHNWRRSNEQGGETQTDLELIHCGFYFVSAPVDYDHRPPSCPQTRPLPWNILNTKRKCIFARALKKVLITMCIFSSFQKHQTSWECRFSDWRGSTVIFHRADVSPTQLRLERLYEYMTVHRALCILSSLIIEPAWNLSSAISA